MTSRIPMLCCLIATVSAATHHYAGPFRPPSPPSTYDTRRHERDDTRAERLETLEPDAEILPENSPPRPPRPPRGPTGPEQNPGRVYFVIHPATALPGYRPGGGAAQQSGGPLYIITHAAPVNGADRRFPVLLLRAGDEASQPGYSGPYDLSYHRPPAYPYVVGAGAVRLSRIVSAEETPRRSSSSPPAPNNDRSA